MQKLSAGLKRQAGRNAQESAGVRMDSEVLGVLVLIFRYRFAVWRCTTNGRLCVRRVPAVSDDAAFTVNSLAVNIK